MSAIHKIGQKIRAVRKAQGLTQEQLAAMCGVGVRFLREVEKGKEAAQIGKVLHVLKMLGLEIRIQGEPL